LLRLPLPCAQPRQVHRNAVTDVVENVTFVHCPPERRILVNVPVRVRRASAACMCSQCGKSPRVLTMRLCAMLATPLVLPRARAWKGAPACIGQHTALASCAWQRSVAAACRCGAYSSLLV
jgi:hypothetical protein